MFGACRSNCKQAHKFKKCRHYISGNFVVIQTTRSRPWTLYIKYAPPHVSHLKALMGDAERDGTHQIGSANTRLCSWRPKPPALKCNFNVLRRAHSPSRQKYRRQNMPCIVIISFSDYALLIGLRAAADRVFAAVRPIGFKYLCDNKLVNTVLLSHPHNMFYF